MTRPLAVRIATVVITAALAYLAGWGTHVLFHPAPRPAACSHPSLPSGDQERIGGAILTCTDGVWHTK